MFSNSCERPCNETECNIEKCPNDLTAPYVCTFPPTANEFLGCSADPSTCYEACVLVHHDEFEALDGKCKDGVCTCDEVFGGPPVEIDFDCSKERV